MRLLEPSSSRAGIDARLRAARYRDHDPARWALPLLDAIERRAPRWTLVELDADEFGGLWLPGHHGEACHGDTARLGDAEHGATVHDAAAWLDRHLDRYASANPSCWGRLLRAAAERPGPIVVSRFDVGDRVKPGAARLVVVDGLHRTLAWWRRGDRTSLAHLAEP